MTHAAAVIASERHGDPAEQLIERIVKAAGAANAVPMNKTIARLLHAEQLTARTNRIVPPPHFPIRQYGESRRVGKLRPWNKVPYVENATQWNPNKGSEI